ncbi:MAG: transketolase [Prevotellaceae bacterium]|nr:transketolase [Candidatus Faecinaster equi]
MSNSVELMNLAADNIRILSAAMVEKAHSGHPGGAMGGADFINVLFSEYLVEDPRNPRWSQRDRFFLDPGHMSPMLYSELTLTGKFTLEEIQNFRQWGSTTPGHPEVNIDKGIENSSGPLGQGHAYAVGAAIAAKFLAAHLGDESFNKEKIYTYISDGGIQEEISQGTGRIAGHLGLNNLIMFYDSNDIQLSTECGDVTSENTAMKYRAWNWNVLTINGNDCNEIREALNNAIAEKERPTLIIGKCVMGKGCKDADNNCYERSIKTHGAPLGQAAYVNTVKNLGGNPDNPFIVYDEVKQLYEERKQRLIKLTDERHKEEEAWAKNNPEAAKKEQDWFAGKLADIDWKSVTVKEGDPTRNASAAVLATLSEKVENMVVSSADLCNSDKTEGFLKHTHIIKPGDFTGNFLQAGVAELSMACICIGMTLHGGVMTAMGTFFVFSDYMKPAIRMAALMQTPVKFVWSHDSFRVGEDGPTHEPIEQEAQIRLLEKMKNHSGKDSLLVLRPADVHETVECWKMAMHNNETPTALILSRQTIESLPQGTNYEGALKGGYTVIEEENPDIVLVADGSEVSTLVSASELLKKDGIKFRIVSVPSEGLFRQQSYEYQQSVLPAGIKKFALTAGLPVNMQGLVGSHGKTFGVESFGYSAPYKVLDEKFGFNAENVYKQIKEYLAE